MRRVKVMSANDLSSKQKEKIELFFSKNRTEDVVFDYSTDKKLIAGITVTDGNTVYDGSMANKIAKVRNFIK